MLDFFFKHVSQPCRRQVGKIRQTNHLFVIEKETGKGGDFHQSLFPTSATHLESVGSNLQTAVYFRGRNTSSPSQLFHSAARREPAGGAAVHFPSLTV